MSQPATTETPHRRGRSRNVVTPVPACDPRFPGVVIPLTFAGRLRPGAVCEIIKCVKCHENNGLKVVVQKIGPDGCEVQSLDEPLVTFDATTGEINAARAWVAIFKPYNLYRIGYQPESRHV